MGDRTFRVGFSADFLDDSGQLIFPDIGLDLLDAEPGIEYQFLPEYCPEYKPEQLGEIDVLISLKPRVTAASLKGVTRLCAIGRCGVGFDNVDLRACTEADIAVYTTPKGVVHSMAESVILLILALSHNLVRKDHLMRQGKWAESVWPLGIEPRGRTIGTVGLGNIASQTVRLLSGFNVNRFLAFDPFVTSEQASSLGVDIVGLDDLLRLSDYITINCPLNASTRHMIGVRELHLMKKDAFLINTARGPIVDEAALVQALEQGWIRGAALDVFEREPLDVPSRLLQMENVIVTSHSIGWTEELFRDMGRIDCEGALAVKHGRPPESVVNPEVLDHIGFRRKLDIYRGLP